MTPIEEMRLRSAAAVEEAVRELERQRRQARPEDYLYDKSQEAYWDMLDGTMHTERGVDASIPKSLWRVVIDEGGREGGDGGRGRPRRRREELVPPSKDIMRVEQNQLVEGSTWWPGMDRIVADWLVTAEGCFPAIGRRIFNQYRPPPEYESTEEPVQWIEHVKKLWPEAAEHEFFFDYCAHMVQKPEEKCNAAIILSGTQGIGKDAALLPVRAAIGVWNSKNIDPDDLFSSFRPFLQTLMLIIDEVRPSKDDFHASSMYNILKPMIATPPETLPLNDKHVKLRHIVNCLRVFITTNDFMSMYIPEEDRRLFIMHSHLPSRWFEREGKPRYFAEYFRWLEKDGGLGAVACWLKRRDLSKFNPKQQIAHTEGWAMVAGSWEANDDWLSEALERLGRPPAFFGQELMELSFDRSEDARKLLQSRRRLTHRMLEEGYHPMKAPAGQERWSFSSDGGHFKARVAFVRRAEVSEPAAAVRLLEERGQALARRAAGKKMERVK